MKDVVLLQLVQRFAELQTEVHDLAVGRRFAAELFTDCGQVARQKPEGDRFFCRLVVDHRVDVTADAAKLDHGFNKGRFLGDKLYVVAVVVLAFKGDDGERGEGF